MGEHLLPFLSRKHKESVDWGHKFFCLTIPHYHSISGNGPPPSQDIRTGPCLKYNVPCCQNECQTEPHLWSSLPTLGTITAPSFLVPPVVRTLHSHGRGLRYNPWLGNLAPTSHVARPKIKPFFICKPGFLRLIPRPL